MKLKSTSCLLIILAFIIFIGTNEDSYAKGKKKKAKMQIEMEEYVDVGLITDTPKFKADTEKEFKWANDKTKEEILQRAMEKMNREEKDIKIFFINGVTIKDIDFSTYEMKYIPWGEMEHKSKNGKIVKFYYFERRM